MSFIAHTFNTIFCMYQMKYNKDWDKKLNTLLDEHWETAHLSELGHTVKLGDFDVWISNKWYAYGSAYRLKWDSVPKGMQFRPSIFTMRRLDLLIKQLKGGVVFRDKAEREQQIKEFFS